MSAKPFPVRPLEHWPGDQIACRGQSDRWDLALIRIQFTAFDFMRKARMSWLLRVISLGTVQSSGRVPSRLKDHDSGCPVSQLVPMRQQLGNRHSMIGQGYALSKFLVVLLIPNVAKQKWQQQDCANQTLKSLRLWPYLSMEQNDAARQPCMERILKEFDR